MLVSSGVGLSVNIATGRAYLLASGGNGYPVINDAQISNLSINANPSGNPRYTSTVLYKDLGASPNADDTNTTFVVNIDGTPAASPNPPSGSTIQSTIGAGNPYIVLANNLINSGASAPTHIYDVRAHLLLSVPIFSIRMPGFHLVPTAGSVQLTLRLFQLLGKKFQIDLPNRGSYACAC